uniref:Uncharacterized protein n=1 Tax=Oryza sativa subsp. japonica TaxID=39947 RepID=Q6K9F2_ORYSJ|nr:hypothetical protein [Oryza sativa Japonica Group]
MTTGRLARYASCLARTAPGARLARRRDDDSDLVDRRHTSCVLVDLPSILCMDARSQVKI